MNFRHGSREEPEINLIPFIDILLVVLIFLMLTTTYSRYTELRINLPTADAEPLQQAPTEIVVSVSKEGRHAVNGQWLGEVPPTGADPLVQALLAAQGTGNDAKVAVVISADAAAPHQSVIHVMDAARRAGLQHITFATQSAGQH